MENNTWQPIDSAPSNQPILICGGLYYSVCSGKDEWFEVNDRVYMAERYGDNDYFSVNDYFEGKPTYWMPLPLPPSPTPAPLKATGEDVERVARYLCDEDVGGEDHWRDYEQPAKEIIRLIRPADSELRERAFKDGYAAGESESAMGCPAMAWSIYKDGGLEALSHPSNAMKG